MSNSLDDGAQFAGSDTSLPPGPFSASSRGTFGRLQAPRHGVANTNAALKSDADRNRGGGEKNEKSRQKLHLDEVEDQKSNRRGRRQKTSESNPLRSPPPDQVRLGTPVPYSQSRESKMTKTQKSVKYRMVKSYLTHTRTQRNDMDDVGPRWWRWTEMGRPTRFREEHRATEVKASTCYQRRSVIGTELPIKKSKSSVGEAHE